MNHWSHHCWNVQGAPRIAFFSTMCHFLLHFSRYSIALNLIFTAYILSPTFPNCLSSLQQIEPTPSQVRNHYSQNNQEEHIERALAFKKAANLHFPSDVCLPIAFLHISHCRWGTSLTSLMKLDNDTNQEIGDDKSAGRSEDTRESTVSSAMEDDDSDYQQLVLLQGQAHRDKSWQTTRVPLLKTCSPVDTLIERPLLPNSRKPPGSMAPSLLKCLKSALLNKSSESDHAPSAQAVPQPKSSGDQNVPQHKASAH